jgi:hypothetical protein
MVHPKRKKPFQGIPIPGMAVIVGAVFAVPFLLGTVSCQREGGSAAQSNLETVATIRVEAGNGRLAGGEEYSIAEWKSGSEAAAGSAFAHFRGQDGGPTLDLSLTGLKKVGTFSCAGEQPMALELRVDVNNAYRASPDAPCRVVVQRMANGHIEGHYTAVLRHAGNPYDEMAVSGEFRATLPAPEIQAAKGPKLLGRP